MAKKTKNNQEIVETAPEVIKTIPEEIDVVEEDPKNDILREFASIIGEINKSTISNELGNRIWKLWQQYSGRTDRWRGCGGCLVGKIKLLKRKCRENGIEM